jgi:hypothetical protein
MLDLLEKDKPTDSFELSLRRFIDIFMLKRDKSTFFKTSSFL